MGGITAIATGSPSYCSVLPNTMSPIARTLKLNGYATAQFGKCHEIPVWQTSPAGPFDAWPTGGGGWDKLREEIFARQKELGIIPEDAELTARPDEIVA
jgi:arylsulfatase A-like enzyme